MRVEARPAAPIGVCGRCLRNIAHGQPYAPMIPFLGVLGRLHARSLSGGAGGGAVRLHDLPPRWDDRIVTWTEWTEEARVIICPPPRRADEPRRCDYARGTLRESAWGIVADGSEITQEQLDADAENRRRLGSLSHKRPLIAHRRLHVLRCCHECCQDTVYDIETDEAWELDDSDYGDLGSLAPAQLQPSLF